MPYKDPEKSRECVRRYRRKNWPVVRAKIYAWRAKNRDSYLAYRRKRYVEKNLREACRIYVKQRTATDRGYAIRRSISGRIRLAINGKYKLAKTWELIGCSKEYFFDYIAAQFTDGMSWDNWGRTGWHLDHKIPCSHFDMTDPMQQKTCFHYTNYQPLWASDNLAKGIKTTEEYEAFLQA